MPSAIAARTPMVSDSPTAKGWPRFAQISPAGRGGLTTGVTIPSAVTVGIGAGRDGLARPASGPAERRAAPGVPSLMGTL